MFADPIRRKVRRQRNRARLGSVLGEVLRVAVTVVSADNLAFLVLDTEEFSRRSPKGTPDTESALAFGLF